MQVPGSANALMLGGGASAADYTIARSLRLRRSAGANLSRTPGSATNRQKFTFSAWVKRGALDPSTVYMITNAGNGNSGGVQNAGMYLYGGNLSFGMGVYGVSTDASFTSSAVFRDPSAWYHIVLAFDTTQATSSDRIKLYVNGVQQTFSSVSYPSQNYNTPFNNNVAHRISNSPDLEYFDGYMTEVNFIDGQQLTPSSFGETDTVTGVWKPKAFAGTYGTNGYYLTFSDNGAATATTIGKDYSGNGNNWTPNNISVTSGATYDSMTDVPTLTSATAANYAVANPLNKHPDVVVSDGNIRISLGTASGGIRKTNATIALPSTGKYYWESKNVGTTNFNFFCGIQSLTASLSASATGEILYNEAGEIQNNGSSSGTIYGNIAANDILGMAYDADNNKIYFYKNNVLQNSSGSTPSFSAPYIPFFGMYLTNNAQEINFGQRPFAYTPPSGFVALNTFNLPDPSIKKGSAVMDATTYTGTGANPQTVTNTGGFQPDLIWVKGRSNTAFHQLADTVRGVTKFLYSNATSAEDTNAINGYVSSSNSNGFNVTAGSNSGFAVNESGTSYVAWQWQAGAGSSSSNTAGSITSTVSANPSAGFSIVTYTGTGANATVGHGLGVAPKLILLKSRGGAGTNWTTYHASLGATQYVFLNLTNAAATASTVFNNTAPTSSVFSLGTDGNANTSSRAHVAYCFSEVDGYSKFGSYVGNGSADGIFVHLGFRPKFLMIKGSSIATEWLMLDAARNPTNIASLRLQANLSNAEDLTASDAYLDFVSNGFKFRKAWMNDSGQTFIYIAFAENPFKYALAR